MESVTIRKFAFVLGREQELCLAELKAVLNRFCFDFDITSVSDNVALINLKSKNKEGLTKGYQDALQNFVGDLSRVLGGTMKIFQMYDQKIDRTNLNKFLTDYIRNNRKKAGKLDFGISSYSILAADFVNRLGLDVKKNLRNEMSLRFVAARDSKNLPLIVTLKNGLANKGIEFGLFDQGIGVLIGLSNPEEWSQRDYDKPAGDKRSGMLPPKLARMMVNLALGQDNLGCRANSTGGQSPDAKHSTLNYLVVDPFCGSGNVLLEALVLGCDVFGSDISEKAVSDTKTNLNWQFDQSDSLKAKNEAVFADATKENFSNLFSALHYQLDSYDSVAVVTEPYLGEPKKFQPTMNAARGEYKKIRETYLSFFKNMSLSFGRPKKAVFCVVFPLIETLDGGRFSLFNESVDEIKKIGYTLVQRPLIYGRDYQVVKREIAILKYDG